MTPHADAVRWPRSASALSAGAMKWAMAVCLGLAAAAYLGGFLFLWSLGLSTQSASPLTLVRYGYYYADRPWVNRRLTVCAGVGSAVSAHAMGGRVRSERKTARLEDF